MKNHDLTAAVSNICAALEQISSIFTEPDHLSFSGVRKDMERLEEAMSANKAFADSSFAFICDRDGAGSAVGANNAAAYLREVLGLSQSEAMGRIQRGKDLFADIAADVPEDEELFDEFDPDDPDSAEAAAEAAAAAEEARRKAEEQREAQRKAKEQAKRVAEEKQKIINAELMSLRKDAEPGRAVLLRQALEEAEKRTPEDLKKFVRRLVQDANRRGRNRGDKPGSDFNARNMHFGKPDSAGMCRITITAPAGEASMIKAAMDAGRGGIGDAGQFGSGERDTRTMGQRQFDHLMNIVRGWSAKKSSHQNGVGSVVVALTLEDLMGADYNTRFMTNTGIEVSCYDLLRMGFTGTDFLAQLDSVTGVPLSLGKTRLATVYQRIALLAMQGVCAWHGCDKPMSELDIHHIIPFLDGGPTDIDNLIGLCRQHHMCNNDRRDGAGNKGYVDRDPDTGRVGVVPADGGPMRFNETVGAHDSPGHKIRVRHEKQRSPDQGRTSGGPSHSSDPALFPVPT